MARICIDMDGVLADTYFQFADAYAAEFGRVPTREELLGLKVYELAGAAHLRGLMHQPGFFRHVKRIEGAVDAVRELYEQHEVWIVTSIMEFPNGLRDKWDWLAEYFPFIHHSRIVMCGSKQIVSGDYMIDDKVSNLAGFDGTGLLFSSYDNHFHTGYHRVNDWQEVLQYFRNERDAEIAEAG